MPPVGGVGAAGGGGLGGGEEGADAAGERRELAGGEYGTGTMKDNTRSDA